MSASAPLPVARAAARLGALTLAWLGTLEALAGVALEVKLKGMYLGPGAEWSQVLTRLVDVTVIWKSAAAHAALGALAGLALGALADGLDRLVSRSHPRARRAVGPRAFGLLAGAGVAAVTEYALVRRGLTGALWPLDTIGAADLVALVPLVGCAWLAARGAERGAAAIAGSRAGARTLPWGERAGWVGLASACAVAFAVSAVGKPSAAANGTAASGTPAAARPPDVVLLVLDTARADRFSTFGAARPTSPNLTALAERGTRYTQAMSTAPWTLPSHGTLFTGELPHRHGADWGWMQLRPEMRTLAETFRDAGYRTAAFTNNPWIGPVAGLDRGFDELHPMWRRHGGTWDRLLLVRAARRATGADPDEGAADTIAELDRWLANAEAGAGAARPVFLFVNLMELHDPNWPERGSARWLPPGTTRSRLRGLNQNPYKWFARRAPMNEADFALLGDLYDAQVSYLDECLAELVQLLDARRGLANVVLAIVGDHGENLGDHGLLSHVFSLHQSLVHVPLLLVAPGRVPAGRTVDEPVSLVDVAPTLEGIAGVGAAGAPGRRGRNLLSEPPAARAERVLVAEHPPPGPILDILRSNDASLDLAPFDRSWLAAREGDWKLIVNGDGAAMLFDLAADPGETRDVSTERPEVVARLRDALAEPLGRIPASRAAAAAPGGPALDPETIARLHALGYM